MGRKQINENSYETFILERGLDSSLSREAGSLPLPPSQRHRPPRPRGIERIPSRRQVRSFQQSTTDFVN